jgi:hypothetical protein
MRNKTARTTVKSNSKQIRNIGSARNVFGVRLSHPQTELLGTEAIRARQIEAVVRQNDRFLGKTSALFMLDIILTDNIFINSNDPF